VRTVIQRSAATANEPCDKHKVHFISRIEMFNSQKHAQDTSVLSFLLHQLFPEYEQRTLYGALVVTLAMLLHLINCRFNIIIITEFR